MKTPFLSLLLGAATLIPIARGAAENDAYTEIVKTYDRNGDGKLDEDEKVAAKEAMAMQSPKGPARKAVEERASQADPAQRERMLANLRARVEESPAQLRRFDKNGNGKLDDEEWAVARAQFEAREKTAGDKAASAKAAPAAKAKAGAGKVAEVRGKMLDEFDRNGDGTLDETERAAMAAANRAKAEANRQVMRRFDKNRDGKLSDAEWAAARERLGEAIEKRMK